MERLVIVSRRIIEGCEKHHEIMLFYPPFFLTLLIHLPLNYNTIPKCRHIAGSATSDTFRWTKKVEDLSRGALTVRNSASRRGRRRLEVLMDFAKEEYPYKSYLKDRNIYTNIKQSRW